MLRALFRRYLPTVEPDPDIRSAPLPGIDLQKASERVWQHKGREVFPRPGRPLQQLATAGTAKA